MNSKSLRCWSSSDELNRAASRHAFKSSFSAFNSRFESNNGLSLDNGKVAETQLNSALRGTRIELGHCLRIAEKARCYFSLRGRTNGQEGLEGLVPRFPDGYQRMSTKWPGLDPLQPTN